MSMDPDVAFLKECARYFDKLPTNGEDMAHWARVYNAENLRRIADKIEHPFDDLMNDHSMAMWDAGKAAFRAPMNQHGDVLGEVFKAYLRTYAAEHGVAILEDEE